MKKIKVICPYCGREARLIREDKIKRGSQQGMLYYCKTCKAYVGCHQGTNKPLGNLANKELREWRIKVHEVFDKIWMTNLMHRPQAYLWLSVKMDLPLEKTHIGMFNLNLCKRAYSLCTDYIKKHIDN